jgi:hypothetical protein
LALGIALATAGRPGYLIYPLNLLLWRRFLAAPAAPAGAPARAEPAAALVRAGDV